MLDCSFHLAPEENSGIGKKHKGPGWVSFSLALHEGLCVWAFLQLFFLYFHLVTDQENLNC